MQVRTAQPGDETAIAIVKVTTWRSTYAGSLPQNVLDSLSIKDNTHYFHTMIHRPGLGSFILVAENDNQQIVGYAAGGPDRKDDPQYRGEVYALYVLPDFQQQGIGKQLIEASAKQLLGSGMSSMLIWVLADNPARSFYESMGGQYVREVEEEFGEAHRMIVAYGWEDIHSLAFAY